MCEVLKYCQDKHLKTNKNHWSYCTGTNIGIECNTLPCEQKGKCGISRNCAVSPVSWTRQRFWGAKIIPSHIVQTLIGHIYRDIAWMMHGLLFFNHILCCSPHAARLFSISAGDSSIASWHCCCSCVTLCPSAVSLLGTLTATTPVMAGVYLQLVIAEACEMCFRFRLAFQVCHLARCRMAS